MPIAVDPANSTTTTLGPSGIYTGTFVALDPIWDGVSIMAVSDQPSATNGLIIQWSTDGVNLDDEQKFSYAGFISEQGRRVVASARTQFFRVRYVNSASAQTFFRLQTLLRRGADQGSVSSLGILPSLEHDAVSVNAIMVGRNVSSPGTLTIPFTTGDPFWISHNPPSTSTLSDRTITASTAFSQQLDFFGIFGGTRHMLSVFNDTQLGTLFVKAGSAASLTNYHFKIPPQSYWESTLQWRRFSGGWHGIWNIADGSARMGEFF